MPYPPYSERLPQLVIKVGYNIHMNILALLPQWPDPPRQGAAIRNLPILLYLAERHRVSLLTFQPEGNINKTRLEAVCERAEALPMPARTTAARLKTLATSSLPDMAWRLYSDAMRRRVLTLCRREHFDVIHIEGIEMAHYGLLAATIRHPNASKTRNTYDAHNAEYLLQRRAFATDLRSVQAWPKALYSLAQWRRLRRFERQVCAASRAVLAVSRADKAALSRLSPDLAGRITVLPNGVDPDYWSQGATYSKEGVPSADNMLVFDGSMDFRPNVDAALWFSREIWPLIRNKQSQARFFIVGRNPTPAVLALGKLPGVTVTGAVDDPRPWVAAATVYVVPMRMGGGVRLKLLQAMAMQRAIVSTPLGAQGVGAQPGKQIVPARSPGDFAEAVLSLLNNPQRRAALGRAARTLAIERYAWGKLLPVLDGIYPPAP